MRPCSKSLGKQGTLLKGRLFEGMFALKGGRNVRFEGTFALNGFGRWSFSVNVRAGSVLKKILYK